MDEATQSAVSLGVNATIFVIALTITISLTMMVKNIAELAYEFDASLPNGSRVISVEDKSTHIISGYEIISYYANYMTDINNKEVYLADTVVESKAEKTDKIKLIIENENETKTFEGINNKLENDQEYYDFFRDYGIDLDKKYQVEVADYDSDNNFVTIKIKEIS